MVPGTTCAAQQALEERWFERMLERFGTDVYHFVICRLADDRRIGTIGLELIDTVNGNAALGIVVGEEGDRGAGYGTDAVNALVDLGFGEVRLERIWLDVYEGNDRAVRAYEKAGFAREAVLRKAAFHRGEHLDVIRMAILRDEWTALERPKAWDYEISDQARRWARTRSSRSIESRNGSVSSAGSASRTDSSDRRRRALEARSAAGPAARRPAAGRAAARGSRPSA